MRDQRATRQVLTGLALLLATAGAVLTVTLIWPRTHTPVTTETPTSSSFAMPPMDLDLYLPTPSEYPPGFSPTDDGGFAKVQFAFTTAGPGESTPAPCDPEGSVPAQPPGGETPAQLELTNRAAPEGASLSIMVASAGNWKDLSAIRTRLAQCPHHDTPGIQCAETAHQPVPPVPADDVAVVESRCHGGVDFHFLTYYAVVRGAFVYVSASGDDPRPSEDVFGVMVSKARDAALAPR